MRRQDFIVNYHTRVQYLKNNPAASDELKQKILDQIIFELKQLPEAEALTTEGYFSVMSGIKRFASQTVRIKAVAEINKDPGLVEADLVPVTVQVAAYAPHVETNDDYHTFPPHSADERDVPVAKCCGCLFSWW